MIHAPHQPAIEKRVVIIGGGLAGLSAAAALSARGLQVTLLEMRRRVGGRAASFEDPLSGGLVDACQHVAMGCCTNFLDLMKQSGLENDFYRDRTMVFIGPNGVRSICSTQPWLPAPLHLLPMLWGLGHLSIFQRAAVVWGMLRLAWLRPSRLSDAKTTGKWLASIGQPAEAIRLFWQPVMESALGESIDLVDLAAARKVVVDGFFGNRHASDLVIPKKSLGEMFGFGLCDWLIGRGVHVRTSVTVSKIECNETGPKISLGTGEIISADSVVVAVPWKRAVSLVGDLLPPFPLLPQGSAADQEACLSGSPITAVHLWFDRPFLDVPHAVLVGQVSQWVFRPEYASEVDSKQHSGYCQVVISASRNVLAIGREQLLEKILEELQTFWPKAALANLVDWRIVTDPTAVLSVRPGVDRIRPTSVTKNSAVHLAGDWTATGWPSTMEGAVLSGRIAADGVLAQCGEGAPTTRVPDLPRSFLATCIAGRRALN